MAKDMFDLERIAPALDAYLRSINPWWEGNPGRPLPQFKRWAFSSTLKKMNSGLAPIVVICGPRQVGKTTLQLQIIEHLLNEEKIESKRILRVQFDDIPSLRGLQDPILGIVRWYENRILGMTFNQAAKAGKPAYMMLDEVQNLSDWAPQIKSLVDHSQIKVLITGSSALRIEAGRDSLAGRITQVELGTLLLREISELRFHQTLGPFLPENGFEPLLRKDFWLGLKAWGKKHEKLRNRAFEAFSERGGYPFAQVRADRPWPEVADQLNETVIQRAIQHDLRVGIHGVKRDPQLLEEVFRVACRYAGQSPSQAVYIQEIKSALNSNVGWQRIMAYLQFLDNAMLLRIIRPLELRLKRKKGNNKLCICDHGLRASWLQEVIPISSAGLKKAPHLHDLAGHLAESVAGYFLASLPHLDLAHFPERSAEPEVDYVLTVGENRIPMEIKYRNRIDSHRDTVGLRAFLEKSVYNAPFGLLITMDEAGEVYDPRIVALPLSSLLLLR